MAYCDDAAKSVTFTNRTVTWVRFQVAGETGPNVGLREIEVYLAKEPASDAGGNCGLSRKPTVSRLQPDDTDQIFLAEQTSECNAT